MHAVTLTQFGEPHVLQIQEMKDPIPDATQLLVRVKATALNRADLLQRRGKYPAPFGESSILGLEIAGEVVGLGAKVSDHRIGDKVFGLVSGGGYAELCVIDQQMALPIPKGFSFEEAASIPEAFLTANEALFTCGKLERHDKVLIHAGASGIGTAAIQLAKQKGGKVFTTLGKTKATEKIRALGADTIINYHDEDFSKICNDINVIIDTIGARYFQRNLTTLATSGRLICLGLMSGKSTEIPLDIVLTKRLMIQGFILRTQTLAEKRNIVQRFRNKWLPLLQSHQLHPVIDSVYPLNEVVLAHQHMEANANIGKIILTL